MLLQSALLQGRPYAMSFSALALAAVYLLLARSVWRSGGGQLRLLAESFLALGVAFVTLAVPLALDGHWTAGTWALEGAAIFWVGLRQQRRLAVAAGLLLQVGAAIAFGIGDDVVPARLPVVNSGFACALLIAVGGFVTARVAHIYREQLPRELDWFAAVSLYWALIWWGFAGYSEIFEHVAEPRLLAASLTFAVLTVLGCAALSRWGDWREARPLTVLLLPAMGIAAAWGFARNGHLLVNAGWLVWPLTFAAWFWLLRWRRHDASPVVDPGLHLITLWFTGAIVAFELAYQVESLKLGDAAWHRIVSGLVPALALAAVLARTMRARWPVSAHPGVYLGVGAGGLAIYLWLWTLFMIFDDASALPLPYLPLVNPVELTQCFALVTAGSWLLYLWRQAPRDWLTADRRPAVVAIAVAVFALLNAVLLRTIHHYAGVPYDVGALMESTLVQAALSVFWGVLALGEHGLRYAPRAAHGLVRRRVAARHHAHQDVPGRPVALGHGGTHRLVHLRRRAHAHHRALLARATGRVRAGAGAMSTRRLGTMLLLTCAVFSGVPAAAWTRCARNSRTRRRSRSGPGRPCSGWSCRSRCIAIPCTLACTTCVC